MGGAPSKQEFRTAILDLVNSNQVSSEVLAEEAVSVIFSECDNASLVLICSLCIVYLDPSKLNLFYF